MSQRPADEVAANPAAHGFALVGHCVRMDDGSYVQEIRFLRPNAGLVLTRHEDEAAVHTDERSVQWAAKHCGGHVAEVWQSERETMVRWGE